GLRKQPARTRVADPITGIAADVKISHALFVSGLRGVLYQQDFASLAPLIIDRATRGDFAPFAAATVGLDQGFSRSMSLGMMLSVLCAEDVPGITESDIDEAAKGSFLGSRIGRDFLR